MRILLTGGAGFIGSAVVRHIIRNTDHTVINIDKLTYAASLDSLNAVANSERYGFLKLDINDRKALVSAFRSFQPDAVMHLAAESHVDRSIDGPAEFINTNVVGTFHLLDVAREYWSELPPARKTAFRFHHISTDEVFGALELHSPPFNDDTAYDPRSPYSASKAAADHLVRAWGHTYGLPVIVTNCTNNYGPFHFPEKLIPLMIIKALRGEPLPVYGHGSNIRDWLFVDDHARALLAVVEGGAIGKTYLIGGKAERSNLQVVEAIADLVDKHAPDGGNKRPRRDLIQFVEDRPGHDFRYAMDISTVERDLGWRPSVTFEQGLSETVRWFIDNKAWWQPLLTRYQGARLGLRQRELRQ